MKIRKDKTFLEMKSNQNNAKYQVVPKKQKLDRGFLGCVECSTKPWVQKLVTRIFL
jgi:hypothetical protein